VLSDIEDAILGQHLEVPVAAMSLLRANFLPKGIRILLSHIQNIITTIVIA